MLRYVEGQYYRVHHDMGEDDNRLACGPRILTFFLYLSDVESGGGTRFPRLGGDGGLTVQPVKGTAILWPSVLDADPTKKDRRTHHEALPVERGIKVAFNLWIHQHDLQTRRGMCSYAGRASVQGAEFAES